MALTSAALLTLMAILLDTALGEPKRWHPLNGFGALARRVESFLYPTSTIHPFALRARGSAAVALLIVPFTLMAYWLESLPSPYGPIGAIMGLYLAVGARSLREHAETVRRALDEKELESARHAVGQIVSRDTADLEESEIVSATVESVLENGCDALFGALFWFALLGLPGVVTYRLANTLDALWGYRNSRYRSFGWAAARLDDGLNYLPARLTALSYALCGDGRTALRAWKSQGHLWKSPNAGPVMAAGAGALNVELGGAASYHGQRVERPTLGKGNRGNPEDITRATNLIHRALFLWLTLLCVGTLIHA